MLAGRITLGFALAVFAGSGLLPRPTRRSGILSPERVCLAAALGLAVVVPIAFLAGILNLPVFGWWIAVVALAVGVAARGVRARAGYDAPGALETGAGRPSMSSLVLLAALAVFAWKVALVPVWTFDHYMVWGMKARRIVDGGFLDLGFLQVSPFSRANPEYPLGLPLAWRVLTLGREPTLLDFKVCHVFFGIAVVLLVRRILREAGAGAREANAIAAFVAVSPLFWDTESLGIADMPLCAMALAALCLLLRGPASGSAWLAGLALGFLPWIKKEGLPLALLLFGAGWVISLFRCGFWRIRRVLVGVTLLVTGGGALLIEWLCLPRGLPFLTGAWWSRAEDRIPQAATLLGAMGRELGVSDWLGFWLVFPLAAAVALCWRSERVIAIFGVVLGQAGAYAFIYLGTYLDPVAHVNASFFRLMATLLPLATVGIGLLARRPDPEARFIAS